MRQRLYFLLPDVNSARRITQDLLLAKVEDNHMHFMAREGNDLSGLHQANLLQTSDLVHGAEFGVVLGSVIGLVAGVAAAFYPIVGEQPQWGMIGILAVLGALFGAWVASMVGASVPNSRLRRFSKAIEAGEILLMVDVPRRRLGEIKTLLRLAHPEAYAQGMEPAIPAFP